MTFEDKFKVLPLWTTSLLVVANIPFSNSISNYLKRRNLPILLTVFLSLEVMHILLVTNFEFQQQNASGKYIIDKTTQVKFTLENQTESFTLPKDNMDSTSKFMLMYNKTGLDTDGAEQIFLTIIQSPAFLFYDDSPVLVILCTIAIIIFSPYMYICSIEGAAAAYFSSLAIGLDFNYQIRMQHCLTGMLINCALSLYLVPSPGAHVAGILNESFLYLDIL